MKTIIMFGILAIFLLLVAIPNAEASVTYKTSKYIYYQNEQVNFILKNNNPYSIEVDVRWPSVYKYTGQCVYGCGIHIMNYEPTTIPAWGSYSWTWNQKDDNGYTVPTDYYKGQLEGYQTSLFRIKATVTSIPTPPPDVCIAIYPSPCELPIAIQ